MTYLESEDYLFFRFSKGYFELGCTVEVRIRFTLRFGFDIVQKWTRDMHMVVFILYWVSAHMKVFAHVLAASGRSVQTLADMNK